MADRTTTSAAPTLLIEGQRLDQPTFHALYEAMPPGTRAELIDGVVYMPSPVSDAHGFSARTSDYVAGRAYARTCRALRSWTSHDDPRLVSLSRMPPPDTV